MAGDYIRIRVHLGGSEEGERRKVALRHLATQAGFPDNISGWLVSLADAEIARSTIPDGVPSFQPRLSRKWLVQLPPDMLLWQLDEGWMAGPDKPEGARFGPWTVQNWLDEYDD